ncbi:MAG: PaaI family thioesterase [Firmicutes bacterium]|nr:PaaI family thioesterase [Bacillota bacterium]
MNLEDDKYCFVCGKNNPIGLKLDFEYLEDGIKSVFTPLKEHQGWQNVTHGGIISTLIDEVMARLVIRMEKIGLTSSMEIRFIRPAPTGEELTIFAQVKEIKGNKIKTVAKMTSKGKLIASGKGTYVFF